MAQGLLEERGAELQLAYLCGRGEGNLPRSYSLLQLNLTTTTTSTTFNYNVQPAAGTAAAVNAQRPDHTIKHDWALCDADSLNT